MPSIEFLSVFVGVLTALFYIAIRAFFEWRKQRLLADEVRKAETEAFQEKPREVEARLSELAQSTAGLEERTNALEQALEQTRTIIQMGRLLNLYSKQIEKYQQQTRSRVSVSFFMAILAMSAGLAFLVWGGSTLLHADESIVLAAGGIVASLGGGISAYVAKTFLDVHRVSLEQLNRYFRQPVVNEHILMAQRLADESNDQRTKQQAYQRIIESVTSLIKEETAPS